MVKIPIVLRLKKESYRKVARAQDIMIEELYKTFERAVLHGGTAIWRCYNGNRFSEDVDVYIPQDKKRIEKFFESLKKRGFVIKKKKISERGIYSNLEVENTTVRFEAVFKKNNGILREYETAEGDLTTIYTLTPEEIIKEKVNAYLKRFKVRDIYDIFFLLRYVENKEIIKEELKRLIDKFRKPSDEQELKVLIIDGLVPNINEILNYIKSYIKWGRKNISSR